MVETISKDFVSDHSPFVVVGNRGAVIMSDGEDREHNRIGKKKYNHVVKTRWL